MSEKTPENYCLLQGFEWHCLNDHKHLQRLIEWVPKLREIGVTHLWIPPQSKAASPEGNGYDVYDLWDLGEFDQKGSRATKWGTREELDALIKIGREHNVAIIFDAVLNHKAGADYTEKCKVKEVDQNDRNKSISDEFEIEGWLGFDFKGRGDKYSQMKYHPGHFSGTDYDAKTEKTGIFQICGEGKHWSNSVDSETGNADYMMFADIDYAHPDVRNDVKAWAKWMIDDVGVAGFRFDAVQHFSQEFTDELITELQDKDLFKFWHNDAQHISEYVDKFKNKVSLFDSPLFYSFSRTSSSEKADLRQVFDKTLVALSPTNACTVVGNHDTQRGQTMEMPIEGWFKPLAHALILLRVDGFPCCFYGDLFGIKGDNPEEPSCGGQLADLLLARSLYSYGEQNDYFNEANCVGWVRRGTHDRPFGLACVISNAGPGQIRMFVGNEHKGENWTDVLGWEQKVVTIDDEGFGEFPCPGISCSIYVNEKADGRDRFGKFDDNIYASAQQ